MTTNAAGNDEWVGIDDITVSSVPAIGPPPATVVTRRRRLSKAMAARRASPSRSPHSDNTGAFSVDHTTANGSATAGSDFVGVTGAPRTPSASPPAARCRSRYRSLSTATSSRRAERNLRRDPRQSGQHHRPARYRHGPGDWHDPERRPHPHLFDPGQRSLSPLHDHVATTGVVTAVDTNGSPRFYIQDATGDGNAATSDAIFMFFRAARCRRRPPGEVSGTVTGVRSGRRDAPPRRACRSPNFRSARPLTSASARRLRRPCDRRLRRLLPPTGGLVAGGAFYEALEGMLVTVKAPVAVGPTNDFGEIFTVVDNDNAANGLNATGLTRAAICCITPGTRTSATSNTSAATSTPSASRSTTTAACCPASSRLSQCGRAAERCHRHRHYNFGNYEVVATQAFRSPRRARW